MLLRVVLAFTELLRELWVAEEISREGLDTEATARVNLRHNGNKTIEEFPIHLDARSERKPRIKSQKTWDPFSVTTQSSWITLRVTSRLCISDCPVIHPKRGGNPVSLPPWASETIYEAADNIYM